MTLLRAQMDPQFQPHEEQCGAGGPGNGVVVIVPVKACGLLQSSHYSQPTQNPNCLVFSTGRGVTCPHRGRDPVGQARGLLGPAGGMSGDL